MKTKTLESPPRLQARPFCACETWPGGMPGIAVIEGKAYMIGYHSDLPDRGQPKILGYWLLRVDGTRYDIHAPSLECDCPDSVYRRRQCKHSLAVAEFIRRGEMV